MDVTDSTSRAPRIAHALANSEAAFARARQVMPGGVSSPVRAFKGVGGTPVFIKEGEGCLVTDVDGNHYIDYVASYGPLIAGHANERVVAALSKAIGRGTSFGFPTESETQLALGHLLGAAVGGDGAVRQQRHRGDDERHPPRPRRHRAGRRRQVHRRATTATPTALLVAGGQRRADARHAQLAPASPSRSPPRRSLVHYNDLDGAAAVFEKYPGQIACFIVEPVAGNMGVVPPAAGYLQGLRELCDRHGALLLFDEVMTGFRVAWGGAQVRYGITPDLTCLGKVIGGGLPCAAYGGPRRADGTGQPRRPVYQAGTLSGNPLAMAGGLATLEILAGARGVREARSAGRDARRGLDRRRRSRGRAARAQPRRLDAHARSSSRQPGQPVTNYAEATACDTAAYATFFHAMLDERRPPRPVAVRGDVRRAGAQKRSDRRNDPRRGRGVQIGSGAGA